MSREQRAKIDSLLRSRPSLGPRTVEEQRAGYAALMSRMIVPDGIRTTEIDLGGPRTLLVDPVGESWAGTIVFCRAGWRRVRGAQGAAFLQERDDQRHQLTPGGIAFLPRNIPHAVRCDIASRAPWS